MKTIKVTAITGPTATGKSRLAIEIAKNLNGEIISADSRLIYKEFNIAVAKPSPQEQQQIPHHLIDVIEPEQNYSVADFFDAAQRIIEKLDSQGKAIIVAGGTGLYFRILLENYHLPRVAPNSELRAELEETAKKSGVEKLHSVLKELDAVSAKAIHPNNKVKIIRAIEVSKTLGIPMSAAAKKNPHPKYEVEWIGLDAKDRQFLYNKINLRVEEMLETGLLEEARTLYSKYGKISSLINTIGYQELIEHFDGLISFKDAVDKIKQNTRRYAKRQLSWFRANKDINRRYIDE